MTWQKLPICLATISRVHYVSLILFLILSLSIGIYTTGKGINNGLIVALELTQRNSYPRYSLWYKYSLHMGLG